MYGVVKIEMQSKLKLQIKSLDSKVEILSLLEKLDGYAQYELSFIDIKTVPAEVIFRLDEIKNSLTLIATEKKLRYYLRELGFRVQERDKQYKSSLKKIKKVNYLALGGSAGSLKKFIELLSSLPPSNLTIFIVMHQRSDMKSSLAKILQNTTEYYNVTEARSDTRVLPSTIYIAPPDKHMIVIGGFIFLTDDAARHFSKPSISTSFESLASEYQEELLTILVCGYGADGSDSLRYVRENGGSVIIEQLYECEATPMLESAIETKEFDYILSISDISRLLKENLAHDENLDKFIENFLKKINYKYGYDYSNYSREHIIRRVEYFYKYLGFQNFENFEESILTDQKLFKDLTLDISINVTTLFRDPQTYKLLRGLLKEKFQDRDSIKIWCAGCSSGEEPYSLAIMLKELSLLDKSLIYATDINDLILEEAKNGLYSKKSFELFKKNYLQSGSNSQLEEYFNTHSSFVSIDKSIQKRILFFRHNLVTDAPLNEFQVILCRNVIIYFDNTLKQKVFNLFDSSLQKEGLLLLGKSEMYDNRKNFISIDKEHKLYEKSENTTC
jgi:chemotaxis protein methyltransferase CheR